MATIHQCHLEAANTPAECSPTASKPPLECQLEVSNAPVIAEWRFDEGAPSTFFGSKLGNAGTRVVADIRLNPSRSTALFDIRVPVELKAFARTTYLHLLIDPVNVQAIVKSTSIPDAVQSPFVGNNTSGHVIGLEFEMTKPISLLGPATARVPKNKKARGALERLKSLAQVAKFTLYIPSQFLSHSQTQQLSAALISGHKYHADWPEFKRMYGGKGAVLLQWDSLETATAPDDASPPSYDQIGPAPPLALESKSSLKKPRRGKSLFTGIMEASISYNLAQIYHQRRNHRQKESSSRLRMLPETLKKMRMKSTTGSGDSKTRFELYEEKSKRCVRRPDHPLPLHRCPKPCPPLSQQRRQCQLLPTQPQQPRSLRLHCRDPWKPASTHWRTASTH